MRLLHNGGLLVVEGFLDTITFSLADTQVTKPYLFPTLHFAPSLWTLSITPAPESGVRRMLQTVVQCRLVEAVDTDIKMYVNRHSLNPDIGVQF